MEGIRLLVLLAAGIYLSARLTRWINWYTYGENSMKRKTGQRNADAEKAETSSKGEHDS